MTMSYGRPENIGASWSARVIVPLEAADAFERVFENLAGVISLYVWDEDVKPHLWAVEGTFDSAPPRAELLARLALTAAAAGTLTPDLEITRVAAKDWLTENIASFPPLRAGRFYIHGDHIKGPFPPGAVRLVINAATAFGSGQHASTMGCLRALDDMLRAGGPPSVGRLMGLDMGCGTGILGMAAAKAARRPVLCADIDPEAVRVTRYNARRNGIANLIPAVRSDGAGDRAIRARAPYGFITANILARPLVQMAPDLAGMLAPGGWLMLAGFIRRDEALVGNTYRAHGLRLVRRIRIAPWTTLVLRRAAHYV